MVDMSNHIDGCRPLRKGEITTLDIQRPLRYA